VRILNENIFKISKNTNANHKVKSVSLQGQAPDTVAEALVAHAESLGPPGAVVGSPIHVPENAEAVEQDKLDEVRQGR
jgi:hypothetical protein